MHKLKKNFFSFSFSLKEKLRLTPNETVLLQQIEYNNNKFDFISIPKTTLAKITCMSRGHFYCCLKALQNKNLIAMSDEGICITDYFRSLKLQDKTQTPKKSALSVACKNSAITTTNHKQYNHEITQNHNLEEATKTQFF